MEPPSLPARSAPSGVKVVVNSARSGAADYAADGCGTAAATKPAPAAFKNRAFSFSIPLVSSSFTQDTLSFAFDYLMLLSATRSRLLEDEYILKDPLCRQVSALAGA
jgi:hypothetical protein